MAYGQWANEIKTITINILVHALEKKGYEKVYIFVKRGERAQ